MHEKYPHGHQAIKEAATLRWRGDGAEPLYGERLSLLAAYASRILHAHQEFASCHIAALCRLNDFLKTVCQKCPIASLATEDMAQALMYSSSFSA